MDMIGSFGRGEEPTGSVGGYRDKGPLTSGAPLPGFDLTTCTTNHQCGPGNHCSGGHCVGGDGALRPSHKHRGSGVTPQAGVIQYCTDDAQCQSGLCLQDHAGGVGTCRRALSSGAARSGASLAGAGEVGGAVVATAAGLVFVALAGVAAVGGLVGAGVAAAVAKPGQKPAYAKGAVIGAASLFGIGILSSVVKG